MSEWISVEDRLPHDTCDGNEFICFTNRAIFGQSVIALTWRVRAIGIGLTRRWEKDGKPVKYEVTHWMPLPNPPEV